MSSDVQSPEVPIPETVLVRVISPNVSIGTPPTFNVRLKRAASACKVHSGNGKRYSMEFSVDIGVL